MLRFTQGPVRMEVVDGRVLLSDLRMGQEPHYSFVFDLGTPEELDAGKVAQVRRLKATLRADFEGQSLWQRLKGKPAPAGGE